MKKFSLTIILMILLFSVNLLAKGVSIRAYFTKAFKDTKYERKIVNRVIKNFKYRGKLPPVGKKCVYILRIKRNGELLVCSKWRSSGYKPFDNASKKSIEKSLPFPPLPSSYYARYLEVHFHFEVIK